MSARSREIPTYEFVLCRLQDKQGTKPRRISSYLYLSSMLAFRYHPPPVIDKRYGQCKEDGPERYQISWRSNARALKILESKKDTDGRWILRGFEDTRQVQCLEEDRCKPESNCSDSCKYSETMMMTMYTPFAEMGSTQWKIRRWWCKTARARKQPHSLEHSYGETSNVPRSGESDEDYDEEYESDTEDDEDSNAGGRGGRSFSYHLAWSAWWQLDLWVYFDVVFVLSVARTREQKYI
jgi:hypothetical protein